MAQIYSIVRNGHQQKKFRDKLKTTYNSICPITGSRELSNLEAAHVIPFGVCSSLNPNLAFSEFNGILMNKHIHRKEFETHKFTFDILNYEIFSDTLIQIPIIIGNDTLNLKVTQYKNKKIKIPKSCLHCLRYHYYEFLHKNKLCNKHVNICYLEQIHTIDLTGAFDYEHDALLPDVI